MRRTVPNRLGLYDDVRTILDAALSAGGGKYKLASHGQAVHWRQRAYKFRKLFAETITKDNSTAMSPYDKLSLGKIDPESSTVVITVREVSGQFVPNQQHKVSETIVPGDELFDVARQVRDKIAKGKM